MPGLGDAPEMWLLGSSSGFSAQAAGALGLPYAHAHHFSPDDTEQALDVYRKAFKPSELLSEPHVMLSVLLITGDSADVVRTESLFSSITFLRMLQGKKTTPVSAEEALSYDFGPRERELIAQRNARQAVGTPDEIAEQLRILLDSTGADELILQLNNGTAAGRLRSLEIAKGLA